MDAKVGGEFLGGHPALKFSGTYSEQRLALNKKSAKAYGYLYLDKASDDKKSEDILDFNREKDGLFIKKATPNLALAKLTFDTYSASGQGIGGMFRPFRDPGMISDPYVHNYAASGELGVEFGVGNATHTGGNGGFRAVNSNSGKWDERNRMANILKFRGQNPISPEYEPYYFKALGEKSIDEELNGTGDMYSSLGSEEAIRVKMEKGRNGAATEDFETKDEVLLPDPVLKRRSRGKRNQNISFLTNQDAQYAALEKMLRSYDPTRSPILPENTNGNPTTNPFNEVPRINTERKAHHLSEATVLRPDGMRYVYGIPAYNSYQKEVTFNISQVDKNGKLGSFTPFIENCATGTIPYKPGEDNTIENERGRDNYYNSVETPGYAHSFLLTSVLSPDYVDVTGDGITDDDPGTAFKINYTRTHDDFRWRTPFEHSMANFNTGFESRNHDDKASYVYGEKEVWYVHSIEGPEFVAQFSYSNREDGLGVIDEDGGKDVDKRLKKLDKISLYSKEELKQGVVDPTPIKTVHFTYDYSLCQGVPNNTGGQDEIPDVVNQGGKLTLQSVYFTYGKSKRGRLNDYRFYYADPSHSFSESTPGISAYNPAYHPKAYDRWGNYHPEDCSPNGLRSWEYPYVDQDNADEYAQAWLLSGLKTPSGGRISIDYEADDYAYVQDKRAMQMFKIRGFAKTETGSVSGFLYKKLGFTDWEDYLYMIVDLPESEVSSATFEKKYLKDDKGKLIEELYVKAYLPIDRKDGNESLNSREMEWIPAYVPIDGGGLVNTDPTKKTAWIKLKTVGINKPYEGKQVHPVAKAAWQYIRANLPEYVFPGSDPKGTDEAAIKSLASMLMEIKAAFVGYNGTMRHKKFADQLDTDRSWVRLYSPNHLKKGGGARVKRISMTDRWKELVGGTAVSNEYGQQYTYTTDHDRSGESISSGVAAYEPLLGGDENPFRLPIRFKKKNLLKRNDYFYLDGPVGESFFPGPQIIYSKVSVESLDKAGVTKRATGHTEHAFYTAKDFPIKFDQTYIDGKGAPSFQVLKWINFFRASQGYVIKRNDMHGKPKSVQAFAENKVNPISGTIYHYRTKTDQPDELDNEAVPVVKSDGRMSTARIGIDMELVVDERQQETRMTGFTLGGQLDAFLALFFPGLVFTVIPDIHYEHTRFRSIVTTKVIDQYGLVDKVESFDGSSRVFAENVAYDAETGEVLLTKATNEFEDPLYNFSYPAHWTYDRMGPAYRNIGIEWNGNASVNLNNLSQASEHLVVGDELLINDQIGWVLDINGSSVSVVDRDGNLIPGGPGNLYDRVKVIRSGRRNLQNTSVGALQTKDDPFFSSDVQQINESDLVLQASAVEFSDQWQMQCGTPISEDVCLCTNVSQAAGEIPVILSGLGFDGRLVGQTTDLSSYIDIVNSPLVAALGGLPVGCSLLAITSSNSTSGNCTTDDLTVQFASSCAPNTILATISLQAPQNNDFCLEFFQNFDQINPILPDPDDCIDVFDFTMDAAIPPCPDGTKDAIVLTGSIDAFPVRDCELGVQFVNQCYEPGSTVNPFTAGIWGNWAPVRSYTFLTERGKITGPAATPLATTDVRNEGVYKNFSEFWRHQNDEWNAQPVHPVTGDEWTFTSEVTKRIPQGFEVESRNPLDQYSTAQYGYRNRLPVAVAGNARNGQIANANFEFDSDLDQNCSAHLVMTNSDGELNLNQEEAHTGHQSALLTTGEYLQTVAKLSAPCDAPGGLDSNQEYVVGECDCAGNFSPLKDEQYIISFWVKGQEYVDGETIENGYDGIGIEVVIDPNTVNTSVPVTDIHRSLLIDGWQRIEGVVNIPSGTELGLKITNSNPDGKARYIDDFRFHPFLSNMKSFVYDRNNLRLLASMDENHFATLYQYDQEGNLISVKQESERGIMSLQEYRQHVSQKDN
ncbi:MAG: hypothetical protein AAF206_03040 [Bacteroidota bacterium]